MADFDLAIIGGGINGTGIARDAAGRGLRVLLVEMNDLASGTSSASSKMIHGGLRYLEGHAFRLVREALSEREVLLRMAPHVIRPTRFLLPPLPGRRNPLVLRLGLLMYDWLGARKLLPASKTVDLTHYPLGDPLKRLFACKLCRCLRLITTRAKFHAHRFASARCRPPSRRTAVVTIRSSWRRLCLPASSLSSRLAPASYLHSTRCTVGAKLPATSWLGAFERRSVERADPSLLPASKNQQNCGRWPRPPEADIRGLPSACSTGGA